MRCLLTLVTVLLFGCQTSPEVLEDDVDALIGTQRWIKGTGVETK